MEDSKDSTIDRMIRVMTAYRNGEKIECRLLVSSRWSEIDLPVWDWQHCEYRVKPKAPNEIFAVFQQGKIESASTSEQVLKERVIDGNVRRIYKYRLVEE